MSVLIRRLQSKDLPTLVELMDQLGHPVSQEDLTHRLQSLNSSKEDFLLVSEDKEQNATGFLHAKVSKTMHYYPSVEVCALVVSSSARNHGIGKALVDNAE
ncbi:MAG: N-acetyltransferase family protein [Bdellovibrio sp.]